MVKLFSLYVYKKFELIFASVQFSRSTTIKGEGLPADARLEPGGYVCRGLGTKCASALAIDPRLGVHERCLCVHGSSALTMKLNVWTLNVRIE